MHFRCVESAANTIENFGLNNNPANRSNLGLMNSKLLCFVVRSILLILKRMVPLSEMNEKLDRPESHPAYAHIMPVLIKCCVPYLRYVIPQCFVYVCITVFNDYIYMYMCECVGVTHALFIIINIQSLNKLPGSFKMKKGVISTLS